MRVWLVVALCAALGGCFTSQAPVFDAARGACPFATPTHYRELEQGQSRPAADAALFTFETDGASCKTTDENGKATHALFVPIGGDWWIVQSDDEHPYYSMMHRSGGVLRQYLPKCQDFSESRLRRLNVTFDDERQYCTVTDAHQVETLFRSWRSPFRAPAGAFREE